MRAKVKLNPGEELKHKNSRSKGPMGEMDIETYLVVNQSGETIGSVVHTDHTALRGFKRTQTVTQKDSEGNVVVDERW